MNLGRAAELQAQGVRGRRRRHVRPPRRDVRDRLADAAGRPRRRSLSTRLRRQRRAELRPARRGRRRGPGHRRATPARAAALARKGCDAGVRARPASGLGERARRAATAWPADLPQAQALFTKACDAGAPAAATASAEMLRDGNGTARATRPARPSCSSAPATATSAPACYDLAFVVGRPRPGARADLAQAALLLRQACTDGDPRGCVELGKLFQAGSARPAGHEPRGRALRGGVRQGSPRRLQRPRADAGGRRPHRPQPPARARSCTRAPATAGIAADCYALGRILQRDSTTTDRKAGVRGVLEGLRRRLRPGLPRGRRRRGRPGTSPKKALGFYQKACAGGQAASCERVKKLQ